MASLKACTDYNTFMAIRCNASCIKSLRCLLLSIKSTLLTLFFCLLRKGNTINL